MHPLDIMTICTFAKFPSPAARDHRASHWKATGGIFLLAGAFPTSTLKFILSPAPECPLFEGEWMFLSRIFIFLYFPSWGAQAPNPPASDSDLVPAQRKTDSSFLSFLASPAAFIVHGFVVIVCIRASIGKIFAGFSGAIARWRFRPRFSMRKSVERGRDSRERGKPNFADGIFIYRAIVAKITKSLREIFERVTDWVLSKRNQRREFATSEIWILFAGVRGIQKLSWISKVSLFSFSRSLQ